MKKLGCMILLSVSLLLAMSCVAHADISLSAYYDNGTITVLSSPVDSGYMIYIDGRQTGRGIIPNSLSVTFSYNLEPGNHIVSLVSSMTYETIASTSISTSTMSAAIGSEEAIAAGLEGKAFADPQYPGFIFQYKYSNNELIGLALIGADTEIVTAEIPSSVEIISTSAFFNCKELIYISIPNTVIKIEERAFSACDSLKSITVMSGNTCYSSIDEVLFNRDGTVLIAFPNGKASNYSVPYGVTSIGGSAFSDCSGLTSITIPDGVTSIGYRAFYNCSAIRYATIGSGGAKALGNAGYSFRDSRYPKISLRYYYNNGEISSFGIAGADQDIENVTFPDGVTSIGDYAFQNCTSLTSISIPDGVTSIGNYAFSGCSSLASITIPDSITSIGNYSFRDCSSLTSITIPDGVTSIGNYAFYGCTSLTSISIPDGVTSIGSNAFYNCNAICYATIGSDGAKALGKAGYSFRDSRYPKISLRYDYNNGEISNLSIVGADWNIETVILPDSVTSIDEGVFYGCSNLSNITIPAKVEQVGDFCFMHTNITKVCILGMNTQMGSDMFKNIDVTVYCYQGSAAEEWAGIQGYEVIYLQDMNDQTDFSVSLPPDFDIAQGQSRDLAAQVFPYGDLSRVTWEVNNPDVLSVNNGVVTAISPGTATVSALFGTNKSSVTINVYIPAEDYIIPIEIWGVIDEEIEISILSYSPPEAARPILSWDTKKAGFSYWCSNERLRGNSDVPVVGEITCESREGIRKSCIVHICYPVTAITLTAPQEKMVIGHDLPLTAHVTMRTQTCVNHLVTFSSSDEAVLTVDADGTAHAVGAGEATITAASKSGKTASVTITVVESCDEHIPEVMPAVAPTCEEAGLTEGVRCARCGAVLTAQEAIPALGHDWGEPTYEWSEDNSAVTACRVCSRDEAHRETETVSATGQTVLEPTCEDMGETSYTSQAFQNSAFAAQTKTAVDQPALGHDWLPVKTTWGTNFATVTGRRVCGRNAAHKIT